MIANIISFLSFIVSFIALYFSLKPVLCKKKELFMTVAENSIDKDKIRLSIVYYNNGYKPMILANSYISLSSKTRVNAFTKDNMFASMKGMKPIMLEGKKHYGIEIEYPISDLSKIETGVDIHIHTSFVCFDGVYYTDNSIVGMLDKNDEVPIIVSVFHERIELSKDQPITTMRGYIKRFN